MDSPISINLAFLPVRPTGLATYAINLLPYLQDLDPTLFIAEPREGFTCYPVPPNMTHEQGRKGHFSRLLWTQFQLPALYRQVRSRLLFSPVPEAPLFSDCRFVVTVHDLIPLRFFKKFTPLWSYQKYYMPQVLKQAEHILCNSSATAQDIVNFFGIPARKITPILLAHDAANFRWLDLPTRNYFLYLGRNDPYKNLHRLISAFASLPQRSDYELWFAGPRDERYTEALTEHIEDLGLTNQVKFLSYVPYSELPVILNQAIALVMPSLWEGFGLPVLEAMACGTPVITSNLSALPEVTGDAALLVDPYNETAIAQAMQQVIEDSGLRSHLRQAGLARASQFSWAKTGQKTIEVLEECGVGV
ncbi:glycosyltransferase family 4 protein [Leptodesmis sichuanensis]|uniref:glycosyltransferase family 4 protein n=1 Tax=Leptodesmis sichuanensis TaxID=2906798 RepID=UPI001F30B58B|nr:glycosyltransferase family 1 protein [Leptodesmis sichuanensis]UIE39382.1 glycosyltransferase family 4 protein [Leptodesmis sichuanensis A121]